MSDVKLRVRWVPESDPDLSYLEQWDTEDKYDGNEILVDEEDARKWGVPSPDPDFIGRGSFYRGEGDERKLYRQLSWQEYQKTYGNPDNHEVLCVLVEKECPNCEKWEVIDSLGNVDFAPAWGRHETGSWTEDEVDGIREPYQRLQSKELLAEARASLGKSEVHCAPERVFVLVERVGGELRLWSKQTFATREAAAYEAAAVDVLAVPVEGDFFGLHKPIIGKLIENTPVVAGKANCGCIYHAEDGIPCEHDIALAACKHVPTTHYRVHGEDFAVCGVRAKEDIIMSDDESTVTCDECLRVNKDARR